MLPKPKVIKEKTKINWTSSKLKLFMVQKKWLRMSEDIPQNGRKYL
jgi:hypothetical protein